MAIMHTRRPVGLEGWDISCPNCHAELCPPDGKSWWDALCEPPLGCWRCGSLIEIDYDENLDGDVSMWAELEGVPISDLLKKVA